MASISEYLVSLFGIDLNDRYVSEALNPEDNRRLAEVGDGVLDLIVKETVYLKGGDAKGIDDARQSVATKERHRDLVKSDERLKKLLLDRQWNIHDNSVGLQRSDDLVEAIIGAIYFSKGLDSARDFIKIIYGLEG